MKKIYKLLSHAEINTPIKQMIGDLHDYYNNTGKYETTFILTLSNEKKRSVEISTRFHGWVTHVHRTLNERGIECDRNYVYFKCLLEACSFRDDDLEQGMSPYPYSIIDDVLYPHRTSIATNNQMMTACFGVRMWALKKHIYELPERGM